MERGAGITSISYLVGGPVSGFLATRFGPTGGLRIAAGLGSLTFLALWITSYYFFYHSMPAAFCIEAMNGLVITLLQAPLFDLAARSTPSGSEALGYGLIMAVWSNVQQFAPWLGATLNHHFAITLGGLIWINVVVAMALVILVPLMPRSILDRREGQH